MASKFQLIYLCILLYVSTAVYASLEDEIGGLIIDRSISRFGKTFHKEFTVLWNEIRGTSSHYADVDIDINISIVESVIPRSGTHLCLEINQEKVFQTVFGRRHTASIKHQVEIAVQRSLDYIAKRAIGLDNPDMAKNGY